MKNPIEVALITKNNMLMKEEFFQKYKLSKNPVISRSKNSVVAKIQDRGNARKKYILKMIENRSYPPDYFHLSSLRNDKNQSFVRVIEEYRSAPYWYRVMEDMSKCTLKKYLKNHTLSEDRVKKLFLQIVSGIQFLHQKCLVLGKWDSTNLAFTQNFKKLKFVGFHCYAPRSTKEMNQDNWVLGHILYEMVYGIPPPTRGKPKRKVIISKQLEDLLFDLVGSTVTIKEILKSNWLAEESSKTF